MRVVIQRVNKASVTIDDEKVAAIDTGLLILLGVEHEDDESDAAWLAGKVSRLRIFNDENGVMNKSICDVQGEIIVVSQFTLHASTKKGNRPSYVRAARPGQAVPLYEKFNELLRKETGIEVKTGKFGAYMIVALENDGPVTILIDTKNKE